jgi:hypothetical protein
MLVSEEMRQCVGFAYYRDVSRSRVVAGTVFFVIDLDPEMGEGVGPTYAVTARHVIDKIKTYSIDGIVWLRLNTRAGGYDWHDIPVRNWKWHPDDDDIARTAYSPDPYYDIAVSLFIADPARFEYKCATTDVFVDDAKIGRYAIGPGDDVFLTGLFVNHLGHDRNLPIVRCGNLAAMPEEPVAADFGPMEAFLIEARSIGGLSGSPCFVSLGQLRLMGRELRKMEQMAAFFLGMVHGHWEAGHGDVVPAAAGDDETINKGIAIVIPAAHILETIRQDALAAEVAEEKRHFLEEYGPVEDPP